MPRNAPTTKPTAPSMRQDLTHILRQRPFRLLFWSFLLCGFPPIPSATAYGLLSLVNLAGMITAGWLSDRINRPLLLASIYFLRALTFILLGSLPGTSIDTLFLLGSLFGTVDYATVPVTASLVASHIGVKRMGLAMGLISASHAIGGASGAFLGGYILTATLDYLWSGSAPSGWPWSLGCWFCF